jgi:hypothetical protein
MSSSNRSIPMLRGDGSLQSPSGEDPLVLQRMYAT